MPLEIRMNINERRTYLAIKQEPYLSAGAREKGTLLSEMESVTGLHRKTLIRLLQGTLERKRRQKQRGRRYGPAVFHAIRVIWTSLDHICAERLTAVLPSMAQHLASYGELVVSPELLANLERISISTVRRILRTLRQDTPCLPRKRPKPANSATAGVPTRRIPRDESQPGHFELDLVYHCGRSASGEFIYTLQMVDVATGWSELMAVLGCSYRVIEDAFTRILDRLPFAVREIHPDNDSSLLNHQSKRFWRDKVPNVFISRSRPWHKNDNRLVEEKNSSLVRNYLGHDRLDSVAQTIAVNQLYEKLWIFYNLFLPVMHLQEKTYTITSDGVTRIKRRFDTPQTPFDRLCATDAITQQDRETLDTLKRQTNPLRLREEIYALIDYIFTLPAATPGTTEDIFLTLRKPKQTEKGDINPVTLSFE